MRKNRPYMFYDTTSSVCCTCLRPVEAKILFKDERVYMDKWCPAHGTQRVLISDDADFCARFAEPQHRLDEIGAERTVDPRRAQDRVIGADRGDLLFRRQRRADVQKAADGGFHQPHGLGQLVDLGDDGAHSNCVLELEVADARGLPDQALQVLRDVARQQPGHRQRQQHQANRYQD